MLLRIEAGKINVVLSADEEHRSTEAQEIVGAIGSAHLADDGSYVSCALSANNLRKLRRMYPDLHRSPDDVTISTIQRLRADQDKYEAESKLAEDIKGGTSDVGDYQFKVPPFAHQVLGFRFLRDLPTPALFGSCGSGKTFIVATVLDSLVKRGEKIVGLVVCPVNLIGHVWLEDVAKFTDLTAQSLRLDLNDRVLLDRAKAEGIRSDDAAGRKALLRLMRKEMLTAKANVYVVNPESVRGTKSDKEKQKGVMGLLRRLRKEGYQIWLILDESSRLKTRSSATYRTLREIRPLCSRCVIMTGTPSPNGVLDLWAQFHILDGGKTLQPSFTDYRHDVCHEVVLKGVTWQKGGVTHTATKWVEKKGVGKEVYQVIKPRMVRFRLRDCIDLPEQHPPIIREVPLSTDQMAVYADMEDNLFAQLESGEDVTARVAATRLMKLREITGGFVISDIGNAQQIGKEVPKMLALDELLEQSIADQMGDEGPPLKAIVWAQYQWECKALVERYKAYGARGLFGGISQSGKDDAIRRFKTDDAARLLVCHPASAGHGLTLTEANYAFYYSLSYNYEELYQSSCRIVRPGQRRQTFFYFLVAPRTIDEDLLAALTKKQDLSNLITDGRFTRDQLLSHRGGKHPELTLDWEVPDGT